MDALIIKKLFAGLLFIYVRLCGGIPHAIVWRKYVKANVSPDSLIADVGGGDGELANFLAPDIKRVFIVDKESTSREGADTLQYEGVLSRALKNRKYQNISPIKGDAISLPFADGSLDIITACELIEHLNEYEKDLFFSESNRVLKKTGLIIISTPNAAFMQNHRFFFSRMSRKIIPPQWIRRLPNLLRGPWLEQSIEQWEVSVGHYDRGCTVSDIKSRLERTGFSELSHRYLHTPLTTFWLQLMLTFPLVYLLCIPVVRLFYSIESRFSGKEGASILIAFRKLIPPPAVRET